MGDCKFCGQPAGFLRSQHKECEKSHAEARKQIQSLCWAGASGGMDVSDALNQAQLTANSGWVRDIKPYLIDAFGAAVRKALDDGVLEAVEDEHLALVMNGFGLSSEEVRDHWLLRCKGLVIREVLKGRVPTSSGVSFSIPLILQKGETVIWGWSNVKQFQERTRTTYQGSSQGISFKIAKGVYYRTGAFKGQPVVTTHQALVGVGALVFTQKHLYWGGGEGKALRIPWKKILAVQGYSDGVGIQRDAANAKPMIFQIAPGEGWLAKNLAENIPHIETP